VSSSRNQATIVSFVVADQRWANVPKVRRPFYSENGPVGTDDWPSTSCSFIGTRVERMEINVGSESSLARYKSRSGRCASSPLLAWIHRFPDGHQLGPVGVKRISLHIPFQ
jgi:hypothetical protein